MYEYTLYDKDKEVGYVVFNECFDLLHKDKNIKRKDSKLLKDYPELGVVGNRLVIRILLNQKSADYSGIGYLADCLAVEHCLRRGVEPCGVSEAYWQSHMAHYLRRKRFIPEEGKDYDNMLQKIKDNRKPGEIIDTTDLGKVITYMAKEMI